MSWTIDRYGILLINDGTVDCPEQDLELSIISKLYEIYFKLWAGEDQLLETSDDNESSDDRSSYENSNDESNTSSESELTTNKNNEKT